MLEEQILQQLTTINAALLRIESKLGPSPAPVPVPTPTPVPAPPPPPVPVPTPAPVPGPSPKTKMSVRVLFQSGAPLWQFDISEATRMDDWNGRGFVMQNHRVKKDHMTVFFRPDVASDRVEFVVEWGSVRPGPAGSDATVRKLPPCTLIFFVDGAEVGRREAPTGFDFFTRTRWYNRRRSLLATPQELLKNKLGLPYSTSVWDGVKMSLAGFTYTKVGDTGGITPYMPQTGERNDLGMFTSAQAEYLLAPTPENTDALFAFAEGYGSFPSCVRQDNGAPLNVLLPGQWLYNKHSNSVTSTTYLQNSGVSVNQIDTSHHPNTSLLPFLLTDDPYYLENIHFAVIHHTTWTAWDRSANNSLFVFDQLRGIAWALRDCVHAKRLTPAITPNWLLPHSYFDRYLSDMVKRTDLVRTSTTNPNAFVAHYLDQGVNDIGFWQHDMMLISTGYALLNGFSELKPLYDWLLYSIQARTSSDYSPTTWPRQIPSAYWFKVGTAKNFGEMWAAAAAFFSLPAKPPATETLQMQDPTYGDYAIAALKLASLNGYSWAANNHAWYRKFHKSNNKMAI